VVALATAVLTTGPKVAGAAVEVAALVEVPVDPSFANLLFDCLRTPVDVPLDDEIATAKRASPVPIKQRTAAVKNRGLKKPDCELVFFRMDYFEIERRSPKSAAANASKG
jgi:hypothetical protein